MLFLSEQETIEKQGDTFLYSGMLSILLKNYEDLRNKASLKEYNMLCSDLKKHSFWGNIGYGI